MSHHRYSRAVCWSICLSSALPAYSFNLIFISLKSSPTIFCSVCRRSASILSLICVFLQPSSSRRSHVPPQVQPHYMVTECLSSLCPQLPPMCSSYPLPILLIPSPTHLLCWILTLCVQYFLNLLLRAFLCLPQIPSFPAAAPYEAITITGTAPLADINIELLWLITNITASFGGGVNWR